MQITGSTSLTPMRRPSSMSGGQLDQRLVFIYPILFDSSLQKYAETIRDFISVDFISQIKISNVLNITTHATQIGRVGSGNNSRNPAQEVRRALWHDAPASNDNLYQDYRSAQDTHRYQEKINKSLRFIQNQLQHDYRLSELRPVVSSLTVEENLMELPLIVGTKGYPTSAYAVYWMLMGAILFDIPINSEGNVQKIVNSLMNLPEGNLMRMLDSGIADQLQSLPNVIHNQKTSLLNKYAEKNDNVNIQKVSNTIRDELRLMYMNFTKCLQIKAWSTETPHLGGKNITWDSVPVIQTPSEKKHYERSMLSFSSYISNIMVQILHGCEMLLGPTPTHVDFQNKVNDYVLNVVDNLQGSYENISRNITHSLRNVQDGHLDHARSKLATIRKACEANTEIFPDIKNVLNELERDSSLPVQFNGGHLSNFTETVAQGANKLQVHTRTILAVLRNIVDDTTHLNKNINEVFDHIDDAVKAFFYPENNRDDFYLFSPPTTRPYGKHSVGGITVNFEVRHSNFFELICNRKDPDKCYYALVKVVDELRESISRITKFLFIWNFFSYTCDYMKDVETDVEIQQRDVLEFPNYCLVLPLEFVKGLYVIHTARNFKRLMQTKGNDEEIEAIMKSEDVMPNPNNVKRMLTIITNRLKIPNIILVDAKRNEFIYKFMYMSQPMKTRVQTIQQYVKHQKDVLPGF